MKDLVTKLVSLIVSLKGKKPAIVGTIVVVFILGYFAVQKGYIPQDLLDVKFITEQVESLFASDSTKVVIDTLSVVDTLAKPMSNISIK
jgi:hypothetical protein